MDWAKFFETMMLVCFGAAWPLSLIKSWRSRTAKGKSIGFSAVVLVGYASGILKVLIADGITGFLLIPYSINFLMVAADAALYFRNKKLDAARAYGGKA
ncbi:MAG: hypothetical protein IJG62_04570 [Synergistaceae bacterium]|nr:hypothetical protein [Synergistaceae bacterium]MBQ4418741.1 hypothetical protein [Synergistaceae bacterium]MBQ6740558.1 hypothetical protein [Synergistaceae bacterium]MBQ9897406.1 hypothetical protein [Synergistaceae bacterium]MBR0044455.1 hypothetical protein [Synergistaceae bacterium]